MNILVFSNTLDWLFYDQMSNDMTNTSIENIDIYQ